MYRYKRNEKERGYIHPVTSAMPSIINVFVAPTALRHISRLESETILNFEEDKNQCLSAGID